MHTAAKVPFEPLVPGGVKVPLAYPALALVLWLISLWTGSAAARHLIVLSLIAYAVLPRRPATFLILLGLGPLTLIRPWVAAAAGLAAAWTAPDLLTAGCAVLAVTGVLAAEPWVHHHWYAEPV